MKMKFFTILLLSFHLLMLPLVSFAQVQNNSKSSSVVDYVPPPLFGGAPTKTKRLTAPHNIKSELKIKSEDKNLENKEIIKLRQNENVAVPKSKTYKNLRKEKALKAMKLKKANSVPIPKIKPVQAKLKLKSSISDNKKDISTTVIDVKDIAQPKELSQQSKKHLEVIKSPTLNQGVVKGPKTMPSVKKKRVDSEIIDTNNVTNNETNMLARVQKEAEKRASSDNNLTKKPPSPVNASLLKDRLVLVFDEKQSSLSDKKQEILNNQVIPAIIGNKRINVTAFASPQEGVLNADKRLALSRALAVREFLINGDVSPSQINVRSLGSQTTKQPYDRVELELIE